MVNSMKLVTSDLLRQLGSTVINFFNRREYVVSPTDGNVLKLYYKYTFWLLMSGFAIVYYNWYARDIIVCASHYNVEAQVRLDYLNICSTFPYRIIDGVKTYFLYYKWVHWVLFLSALAFYIPHKLAKKPYQHRLTRLLDTINTCVMSEQAEPTLIASVTKYFLANRKRQDNLYYRYLGSNVVALIICISVFFLYDVMLMYQYKTLGYDAYPFVRDGKTLLDPLHQVFYPFVKCSIGQEQNLVNKRKETFGCHLTAQEFYEKLFLGLWFVFMGLMIVSSLYILFLLTFLIPFTRKFIIKRLCKVKDDKLDITIDNATENFGVGDWFLLYKLRAGFFGAAFHKLLQRLGDDDLSSKFVDGSKKVLPPLPYDEDDFSTPKKKLHRHGLLIE